jgi:microcin C transport system permease protein
LIDPLLKKQLARFRQNRRGFYSFVLISVLFLLSLVSELLCNNRPLVIHYQGQWFFPVATFYPANFFGLDEATEADYKELAQTPPFQKSGNWMVFPLVPYGPNESMAHLGTPPPSKPTRVNWLGTDDRGRDLLTRLVYGFRNSMIFALISWFFIVCVAYLVGAVQAYSGGRLDFYGQRILEIWDALPVLYVIIFLISVFPASLLMLTCVWVVFSWMGLSSYVRVEVLRVRKMDYVMAARALGAGTPRILFRHILPNTLTPIITFSPFLISASIGSLAALDYLGLGLPPPTASWGELLREGKENLTAWWLVCFPFLTLFLSLLLLNFIGEAVRSAFDAKE